MRGTLEIRSKIWKVAVEAVTRNTSLDTTLSEKAGGRVQNSFDAFVSPVTISSFCIAYDTQLITLRYDTIRYDTVDLRALKS